MDESGAKGLRALVTGSRGFIGGHAVASLRGRGWDVRGLHRVAAGPKFPGDVACDLLDPGCTAALSGLVQGVDAVLHGAARVQPWGATGELVRANCAMTRRVVDACQRAGQPKLVFLSSASVAFRRAEQRDIKIESPLPSRSLCAYAASKAACEDIVRGYDGPWAILRPQAVIGPGDRHLLPPILDSVRRGKWAWIGSRDSVDVDLLSIDNLVHCCASALADRSGGGTWYLSDGEPQRLEPLIREALRRVGLAASERRIPAPVARAFARVVELIHSVLRPHAEPPIHSFGVEAISRTRVIDPAPMEARFGPLPVSFRQGFEKTLAGLSSAP